MNIFELISLLSKHLEQEVSQENAHQEAWWLAEKITQHTKAYLLTHQEYSLTHKHVQWALHLLDERIKHHKPLQYILENVSFCNLDIAVKPPILIPRPETEEWCERLCLELKKLPSSHRKTLRILDLCCGTGCIALALGKSLPEAIIIGSDYNPAAITLAEENKGRNNLSNVTFIQSDLFSNISGTFDLIVSNPPYIALREWENLAPEVKTWEDKNALVAEDDGYAFYKIILSLARQYLTEQSILSPHSMPRIIFEIGQAQAEIVQQFLTSAGFKSKTFKDFAGKTRSIYGYC